MSAHKKPTGRMEPLAIPANNSLAGPHWLCLKFPDNKADIEGLIVEYFIKHFDNFIRIERNHEDSFDFTVWHKNGQLYLELMELIYHDSNANLSPYIEENASVYPDKFAEQCIECIISKSNKYTSHSNTPIVLLTYVTHWRFILPELVKNIITRRLSSEITNFKSVYHLHIFKPGSSQLDRLYPCDDNILSKIHDEEFSNKAYTMVNPSSFNVLKYK